MENMKFYTPPSHLKEVVSFEALVWRMLRHATDDLHAIENFIARNTPFLYITLFKMVVTGRCVVHFLMYAM